MKEMKRFFREETGITNVEIILVIVMIIALLLMFRINVVGFAQKILENK